MAVPTKYKTQKLRRIPIIKITLKIISFTLSADPTTKVTKKNDQGSEIK
jgi:hypothetical protein